jgi:hypothetical protein
VVYFEFFAISPDGNEKLCEVKMDFFLAVKKRRKELFLWRRKKAFLQTNLQCTAGLATTHIYFGRPQIACRLP